MLEGVVETIALKHSCLLGWNEGNPTPEPLADNGTCCLVRTPYRRFAITCDHVWSGWQKFRGNRPQSRLWVNLIHNPSFSEPSAAVELKSPREVATDKTLDLAVFTFDGIDDLEAWRFAPFQFVKETKAKQGDIVHFVGFPGETVRSGAGRRSLNYVMASHVVHDSSHNRFVLHSAKESLHHKGPDGREQGPFRICGASGAPVFKVGSDYKASLVGIVSDLSSSGLCGAAGGQYEMSDGDVWVSHTAFVSADGSIDC